MHVGQADASDMAVSKVGRRELASNVNELVQIESVTATKLDI